jgi:hypothetical protein
MRRLTLQPARIIIFSNFNSHSEFCVWTRHADAAVVSQKIE